MEAVGLSKTLIPIYKTIRRHIPEDYNLKIHRKYYQPDNITVWAM
jgi:hypothetical protein